jgi:segregation and condensation protein B
MAKKKPRPAAETPAPLKPEDLGLAEFRAAPADEGVSLDSLSAAFAEMLGGGDDPYDDVPHAEAAADDPVAELAEELPKGAAAAEVDHDAACEISPRTIVEAMLFVGDPDDKPISSKWIAGLMRGVRPAEIDGVVVELNELYRDQGRPYEIVSEGEGYKLVLRREYHALRDKYFGRYKAVRLSQAAVDVLSVVAYRGPLTVEEVSKLRGTPSGGILAQLVRRKLLRLERAEGASRREAKFLPTKRFLELFGLESLDDLPRWQDVGLR